MQLLFESSEEFGYTKGLSLIEGQVVKFDKNRMEEDLKIPHMGWNRIINKQNPIFKDLKILIYILYIHIMPKQKMSMLLERQHTVILL